jgi:lipopolysaccharide/colanic/teichoic acid biosynthesis glycosyltransferase
MYFDSEDRIHQEYVTKLIRGDNSDVNNGSHESPYYKMKSDPRVTAVGKFIRRTGLDELPQLWNVIKGDMSLVGPRPPIPYEVKEYQNWHYRRVLEAKPGITGLWQVSGRNTTTFDDMVRLDIFYTQNWSLALDCKILAETFKTIFKAEGG